MIQGGVEAFKTQLQSKASSMNLLQADSIAKRQCKHLKHQIQQILESEDDDQRKSCCAMLYGIASYLIDELSHVQSCCNQGPLEINIEGDIKKIQIIQSGCCQPPQQCESVSTPEIISHPTPVTLSTPTPPSQPTSSEPTPSEPTPSEPTPVSPSTPTPSEPTPPPSTPTPSEPTPSVPTPSEPTPSEPTPSKPTPSEPTPSEPTPSEPTPSEPTPSEPTPSEPTPSEPTPSEPTPSKPTPSEPTPSEETAPPVESETDFKPPPEEEEEEVECLEGPDQVFDADHSGEAVIDVELEGEDLDDVSEYGYGFWFRYLTRYPSPLYGGKTEPWYFVARLTTNNPYGDVNFGDRTLALFQGATSYFYMTNDEATGNANVHQKLPYDDIEGVWTYTYFSYSHQKLAAEAFLLYQDNDEVLSLSFQVTHPVPEQLRFVLGGQNLNQYPGFNGQFSKPVLRVGYGAFIGNKENLQKYALSCNPVPKPTCFQRGTIDVQSDVKTYQVDDRKAEVSAHSDYPFPEEYAVSGWFRWQNPAEQQKWHIMFRLTINDEEHNDNATKLGDRDLAAWVGNGNLTFATYSYSDLHGNGNPNTHHDIAYDEFINHWHWVYFGYSREERKAYVRVMINESTEETFTFQDVNHYLVEKHYFYLAKDQFYPSYSGNVARVKIHCCDGSYDPQFPPETRPPSTPTPSEPTPSEPTPSEPTPSEPTPSEPTPSEPTPSEPTPSEPTPSEPTPSEPSEEELPDYCVTGKDKYLDAAFDGQAVQDQEVQNLSDVSEYGYGFWFRFLTRYPVQMYGGKSAPWYFVSRLTTNTEMGDTAFGDRTLAVFQGQGAYYFTTNDEASGNANVHDSTTYDDIEGVWTYLYFSYGSSVKRASGYIKIGSNDIQHVEFDVSHPVPEYLRFVLGGQQFDYAGFNGQFSRPVIRVGHGAYMQDIASFNKYALQCNPQPKKLCVVLGTIKVVPEIEEVDVQTQETVVSEYPFPSEYNVAGWFRWETPADQQPWHAMFRMTHNFEAENHNHERLGDRTLSAFVGKGDEGVLAFATYTYTDLNGEGNPNASQTIVSKDQEAHWHFVYFGYSWQKRQAFVFVEFKTGRVELTFTNVNHYQINRHELFVGRDAFYPGYNGKIGYLSFHLCDGAYDPNWPIDPRPPGTPVPSVSTPTIPSESTPTPSEPTPSEPTPSEPTPSEPTPSEPTPSEPTPPEPSVTTPPSTPTVVEKVCVDGPDVVSDATPTSEAVVDTELTEQDLSDPSEYGYGFWLRFMTRYPSQLYDGKVAPWYFVSRMTTNQEYKNVDFGDRTLAIFLGQGGYHFTTVDQTSGNANVNQNIEYGDIEAQWTYIYFSYSNALRKAVALVNYVDNTVNRLEFDVTHPVPSYLRFVLGGTDNGNYPGFNGQFTRQVVRVGQGSFFDSAEDVITYAKQCNPKPEKDCTQKLVQPIWKENKSFIVDERKPSQFVSDESVQFPEEYAVSGWFKWTGDDHQPYHLLFRLTQNEAEHNGNSQKLGDRTLAAFASFEGEQAIHFATYSYTDLNNHGNPNVHQNVPHRQGINSCHHVYFGYSRQERRALAIVWLATGKVQVEFEQVNHFVSKQLFLYGAKDQFYPSYYGWIYKMELHLCDFDPNYEPSQPPKTPTPSVSTPAPSVSTPSVSTPSEVCVDYIKYDEITEDNVDQILEMIQHKKQQLSGEDVQVDEMCYCTYNPKSEQPQSYLQMRLANNKRQ